MNASTAVLLAALIAPASIATAQMQPPARLAGTFASQSVSSTPSAQKTVGPHARRHAVLRDMLIGGVVGGVGGFALGKSHDCHSGQTNQFCGVITNATTVLGTGLGVVVGGVFGAVTTHGGSRAPTSTQASSSVGGQRTIGLAFSRRF